MVKDESDSGYLNVVMNWLEAARSSEVRVPAVSWEPSDNVL
jgi:hypothetical protein